MEEQEERFVRDARAMEVGWEPEDIPLFPCLLAAARLKLAAAWTPRAPCCWRVCRLDLGGVLVVVVVVGAAFRRAARPQEDPWRRNTNCNADFRRFRPLEALAWPRDRQKTTLDEEPVLGKGSRPLGADVAKKLQRRG